MPNITIHLDDETHRRVKIYAATHRTSISDLFREHIRSLTGSDHVDALASYSRGELAAHDAMDALGITCVEDLYAQTVAAGHELPHRTRPDAQREAARVSNLIAPVRRRA
jgi:plasmid stability protein